MSGIEALDPLVSTDPVLPGTEEKAASRPRLTPASIAWALFEGGRNPYVYLISVYVFMPYFSSVVVGNPVHGQAIIAQYGTVMGLIVAATAPILGASVDHIGARKPLLLACVAVMVPLIFALWWVRPDQSGISIRGVVVIATIVGVLFAYTEVLHNSLLVRAAGLNAAHLASGLGMVVANVVSVTTLVIVLFAFALPGRVDWSFLPAAPLFGLDRASHEPERIVGPIAAVMLALGTLPLLFLTPDADRTGVRFLTAIGRGLRSMGEMLRSMRGHRDAMIFLGARMLFIDAMMALRLFSGVYAAGVMKWGAMELLVEGLMSSFFAALGGFLGGWMDQRLGPKRSLQIAIVGAFCCLTSLLGMSRTRILFFWGFDPATYPDLWGGPMFRTLPEWIYLALAYGASVFITASYGSSRTLLTRLTPPERTGAFFGVYAMSGAATVWLGAILVNLFTTIFQTQQAGFAPVALLLALGFIGLLFVRGGGRPVEATR